MRIPMSYLSTLPELCVDMVTAALVSSFETSDRKELDAAVCAAVIAIVGWREMSLALWDRVVDPGCVKGILADAHTRATLEHDSLMDVTVDIPDTLLELRAACKSIGVSASGTKTKMATALLAARSSKVAAAKRALELAPTDFGRFRERACPVRSRVRLLVRAQKEETRMSASAAKVHPYSLTDVVLSRIPCTLKANPMFRNAAPMRLYLTEDVIRASIFKHGPSIVYDDPIALVKAEVAATKKRAHEIQVANDRAAVAAAEAAKLKLSTCEWCDAFCRGKLALEQLRIILGRRKKLTDALVAAGLDPEPREDSRLCRQYVQTGDGDPVAIADVMREMRFYYKYTCYEVEADNAMDKMVEEERRERRECRERMDREDYQELRDEASVHAKGIALGRWVAERQEDIVQMLAREELPPTLRKGVASVCVYKLSEGTDRDRVRRVVPAVWERVHANMVAWLLSSSSNNVGQEEVKDEVKKRIGALSAVILSASAWGDARDVAASLRSLKTEKALLEMSPADVNAAKVAREMRGAAQTLRCPQCQGNRMFTPIGLADHQRNSMHH